MGRSAGRTERGAVEDAAELEESVEQAVVAAAFSVALGLAGCGAVCCGMGAKPYWIFGLSVRKPAASHWPPKSIGRVMDLNPGS